MGFRYVVSNISSIDGRGDDAEIELGLDFDELSHLSISEEAAYEPGKMSWLLQIVLKNLGVSDDPDVS